MNSGLQFKFIFSWIVIVHICKTFADDASDKYDRLEKEVALLRGTMESIRVIQSSLMSPNRSSSLIGVTVNTLTRLELEVSMLKSNLNELRTNPNSIPVGFIYMQLPQQLEPNEIWPTYSWEDVTPKYAGHFFRAAGGPANDFGVAQSDNAPRLISTKSSHFVPVNEDNFVNASIPLEGNSGWLWTGDDVPGRAAEIIGTQFTHSGGEVRPINYAIRIWKRI